LSYGSIWLPVSSSLGVRAREPVQRPTTPRRPPLHAASPRSRSPGGLLDSQPRPPIQDASDLTGSGPGGVASPGPVTIAAKPASPGGPDGHIVRLFPCHRARKRKRAGKLSPPGPS